MKRIADVFGWLMVKRIREGLLLLSAVGSFVDVAPRRVVCRSNRETKVMLMLASYTLRVTSLSLVRVYISKEIKMQVERFN